MKTKDDRRFGRRVVQLPPEQSFCAGCRSCEIVCALTHDGLVGPLRRRLFVVRDIRFMTHEIQTCRHCADHPCYDACSKKGTAMKLGEDGSAYIDEDACIGCGLCAKACPFDPPRINYAKELPRDFRKARKCDMCRGRAEGPACVEWCPVRCLEVSK